MAITPLLAGYLTGTAKPIEQEMQRQTSLQDWLNRALIESNLVFQRERALEDYRRATASVKLAEPYYRVGTTVFPKNPFTGEVDFQHPIYQVPKEEKRPAVVRAFAATDPRVKDLVPSNLRGKRDYVVRIKYEYDPTAGAFVPSFEGAQSVKDEKTGMATPEIKSVVENSVKALSGSMSAAYNPKLNDADKEAAKMQFRNEKDAAAQLASTMIDNKGWEWYNKQAASGITRGEYFDRLAKAYVSGELGGKDDPYTKDRFYGLYYYGQANLIDIPAKTKLSEVSTLGEHGYTGKDKSTDNNTSTSTDKTKTQPKLMTKDEFVKDFMKEKKRAPTPEEVDAAEGIYWR